MASLDLINYFLPIFSFLFVFLVVFALLIKGGILAENKFLSLIHI